MQLEHRSPNKFREEFSRLDPAVYVAPIDLLGVLAAPSLQAVYLAMKRGDLPEPMIRQNRRIRWTVGQIRDHLKKVEQDFQARLLKKVLGEGKGDILGKRRGRPRKATPVAGGTQ